MILYFIEVVLCQLVFLLTYDLFLKKETFYQWNRVYLLGTFLLSLVLPLIQLDFFKTNISEESIAYSLMVWQLEEVVLTAGQGTSATFWGYLSWTTLVYGVGSVLMLLLFILKSRQIYVLKARGISEQLYGHTLVRIPGEKIAFSFFSHVFLGTAISKEKQERIIAHELVHIRQRHTLDLLFFELMRILLWFNPLVYLYQNRISELHEFIADSSMAKDSKKQQYHYMLSEVFQSQNISFINQFFKKSLIKKRIVMLTKKKSKSIYQLKYLLLLPLVVSILFYTSCETNPVSNTQNESDLVTRIKALQDEIQQKEDLTTEEQEALAGMIYKVYPKDVEGINGELGSIKYSGVPFSVVDEAPIFPGCEDSSDTRACFMQKIQEHIRKHFSYPEEAQVNGIQGRVNIIFRISHEGDIVGIQKRGTHKLLEDEAERIIRKLPKMSPGKHEGKEVNVPFSIPITFKLN